MMTETNPASLAETNYDHQLAQLKETSAGSVDACLAAQVIAIADSRVRKIFLDKLSAGEVFRGVDCEARIGIPEYKYVVVRFDCAPGTFCFVPPNFMVIVDVSGRHVVSIVNPYIASSTRSLEKSDCGCGSSSEARLRNGCDDSVGASIENGEIKVTILGYAIKLTNLPPIPVNASIRVNLHRCGANCTKGARAELQVKEGDGDWRTILCKHLAGDCDC